LLDGMVRKGEAMAYYLMNIVEKCQRCRKRTATHALHTSGTARLGVYCKGCGEFLVKKYTAEDKEKG